VQEAPARVQELVDWGMDFAKDEQGGGEDGPYALGLEGGHSRRRVLHAGDTTGAHIAKTLLQKAKALPNIRFYDFHIAIDLIRTDRIGSTVPPSCIGAYALNRKTETVETFLGRRAVVLATGGAGKVYLYTSNPDVATGDGVAMGYRAGARVANMEFVQFHPTCLYHPAAKSFLISEALRGEGGVLRTADGVAFMEKYHPMKELAPRDIVARAIDTELKRRGDPCVFLDIRFLGADYVKRRFPMIYKECLRFGIDITKDLIPVVPAAHYFCGGLETDARGKTSLGRLWAIGEVACTGLHGANRLASNSLLEGLVFAHRAYETLKAERPAPLAFSAVPPWNPGNARNSDELVVVAQNWGEIRQLMWNYVGIVRSNKRLDRAYRRIQLLQQEIHEYYWDSTVTADLIELRNIATVAQLVVQCAMMRKESRGLHFNLDHPERDEATGRHDSILERPSSAPAAPTFNFV
jgi:L-aspartate oxidase